MQESIGIRTGNVPTQYTTTFPGLDCCTVWAFALRKAYTFKGGICGGIISGNEQDEHAHELLDRQVYSATPTGSHLV